MTKEQIIAERFPNSKIYKLKAKRKKSKVKKILHGLKFIYVDAQAGIVENLLKDADKEFYLVQHGMHYYLAVISGEIVESQSIDESIIGDEFECGGWKFTNQGLIGK